MQRFIRRWAILEDWKIKISVLWLFAAVAYLSSWMLMLIEPGTIANVTAGKVEIFTKLEIFTITPATILLFAIIMLVPLVMAVLSLTLKGSVHRWANIIVGAVFAIVWFFDFVQAVAKLSAWTMLVDFSTIVALALIVWYAWKSKR